MKYTGTTLTGDNVVDKSVLDLLKKINELAEPIFSSLSVGEGVDTWIKFHSSGLRNDYDSEILATGGTTSDGMGTLYIKANSTIFPSAVSIASLTATSISVTGSLDLGTNLLVKGRATIGDTTLNAANFYVKTSAIQFSANGDNLSLLKTTAGAPFPYIEWRDMNSLRGMYLGWGNLQDKYINMGLENSYNLNITGGNVGLDCSPIQIMSSTERTLNIYNTNVASVYLRAGAAAGRYHLYSSAGGSFGIYNTSDAKTIFRTTSTGDITLNGDWADAQTATPPTLSLGNSYDSGTTGTKLKLQFHSGKYGLTVGASADMQYHTDTNNGSHNFYVAGDRAAIFTKKGLDVGSLRVGTDSGYTGIHFLDATYQNLKLYHSTSYASLVLQNDNGYVRFGTRDTTYAYWETDRTGHYFDKTIYTAGNFYIYGTTYGIASTGVASLTSATIANYIGIGVAYNSTYNLKLSGHCYFTLTNTTTTGMTVTSSTNSTANVAYFNSTSTAKSGNTSVGYFENSGAIASATAQCRGITGYAHATGGSVTNIGIYASASGGSVENYSFYGDAGTIYNAGAVQFASTLAVGSTLTLTGDLALNGGDLSTTSTTLNIGATTATTISIGGTVASTTLNLLGSTATGVVNVNSTKASTSYSTGALVVDGGLGVAGAVFTNSTLKLGGTTASTSYTTGTLIVSGGVGIAGAVYTNSSITANGIIDATGYELSGTAICPVFESRINVGDFSTTTYYALPNTMTVGAMYFYTINAHLTGTTSYAFGVKTPPAGTYRIYLGNYQQKASGTPAYGTPLFQGCSGSTDVPAGTIIWTVNVLTSTPYVTGLVIIKRIS